MSKENISASTCFNMEEIEEIIKNKDKIGIND